MTETADVAELYRRSVQGWKTKLAAITSEQWDAPTPCTDWSVRDLVNHVVGEELWTPPLMHGQTIEQVGDRFDGDLLGDDPLSSAEAASDEALSAAPEGSLHGHKVHLSYGEEDAEEYLRQLIADHLIHGWDLAAAIGSDTRLDADLVSAVAAWFKDREELYRSAGAVGPRADGGGDAQSDLLAAAGRRADWNPLQAPLAAFSAAFGSGDIDAIMALMTDDCVFESTSPAPDGGRYDGAGAVRQVWEDLFGGTPDAAFSEEESFVAGDRGVLRWRFTWTAPDGGQGHVRGVDVLRFRDGKVCEKLSYVKG
ncbi:MAG TPA: TIGR03086 family metal-binding protein [Nocardioidaceae bacterium]|jgi:uncharacterized protein (TIGR03086 family)